MMTTYAWSRSRSRRANLSLHHKRNYAIHQTCLVERSQSQDSGSCHAAGATHKWRAGKFCAMHFGQAIDGFLQEICCAMSFAIPLLVQCSGAQPEIRCKVNGPWRKTSVAFDLSSRETVCQAEKHGVT